MPITDPVALYLKMQRDVPDTDDGVSSFHDSEVRGMNMDYRNAKRKWDREHSH